ncbi:MAG TPA: hypothetical protein ENN09_00105 [Planctomycetes bacterium]|nr:hypothetical protein [Planctomycetota bacterium]
MKASGILAGTLAAVAAAVLLALYLNPGGLKMRQRRPDEAEPAPPGVPAPSGVPAEVPAEIEDAEDTAAQAVAAEPPPLEKTPAPAAEKEDGLLKYRWVFSFGYGRKREDVDKVKSLIETAAANGLNGIVLSSFGFDGITRWPEKDFELLHEVAGFCEEKGIELVPTGFSVGYGGGALGHDPNFAAALPAKISLVARGGRCVPAAPDENLLKNGNLEEHDNNRFPHFGFHDQPGEVSFADTSVAAEGKTSIRFENFTANPHGHGRIMQKAPAKPGFAYRFSCKIKTEDLQPVSGIQLLVLMEGGTLVSLRPRLQPTQDWTEITADFINVAETEVRAYAGVWGGKTGRFWLDGIRLYEYGTLESIVRREGTSLELRSSDRPATFAEGRDFEEVKNRRDLQYIALTPETTIKEGEKLELSCYKTPFVGHSWGRQVSLCMSNPALYDYWEEQARRLHAVFRYKKILLSMDEIRNGGGCLLCRNSGMSMAEILGDCITKQYNIFKRIDPGIEVLIWSDMLDPAHNARGDYYGVVGDFTGSWKHVPRELIIACWYHRIRDESLRFFSEQGFRTLGAAYYDADNLRGCEEWLVSLKKTRGAVGIMYTSWERKYELLAGFGELVSRGE